VTQEKGLRRQKKNGDARRSLTNRESPLLSHHSLTLVGTTNASTNAHETLDRSIPSLSWLFRELSLHAAQGSPCGKKKFQTNRSSHTDFFAFVSLSPRVAHKGKSSKGRVIYKVRKLGLLIWG
jgi:hypothetical protein